MQLDRLTKIYYMASQVGLVILSFLNLHKRTERGWFQKWFRPFSFCKGVGLKRFVPTRLREDQKLRATKEWEQERPPACHDLRKSDKQSTEVKGFHEWMQSMACQRSGKFSLGSICGLTFSKKRISTYYPAGKNSFANSEVKPN